MGQDERQSPVGIERDLCMIHAGIEDLREIASDPDKSRDGSRIYDFNVRWGTLMSGRLMRLEYYYRAGELTNEQQPRYRKLRHELKDVAPQTERLGIIRPTVPMED